MTITPNRDEFIALLRKGYRLERNNCAYFYDSACVPNPAELRMEAIPGFMVKEPGDTAEHIMGYWRIFEDIGRPTFKITHSGHVYRRN